MRNTRISTRLYGLVVFALAVLAATMIFFLNYSYRELEAERKVGLAQMDATALAIFDKYYKLEQAGTMSREQAQTAAKDVLAAMRYAGGTGYFWINDMHPTMVMHPVKPELNGTDLTQNKDPNGKFLFVEFVNTVKASGQGFVDYYWPKPGFDQPVLKYSHVAGFAPWGWVVGTGVYADDLSALYYQNTVWAAAVCLFGAAITLAIAYAIVRSVTSPVARRKTAMNAIAAEDASVEISDADRRDEIGQMAKEIKALISSSAAEVEGGVALVRSTGDALVEIEELVNRVNAHVDSIATAAREQATGLQEINTSVNHMDQMTQQNAAMVEETTAASQTLAEESQQLRTLLAKFRLRGQAQGARYGRAA